MESQSPHMDAQLISRTVMHRSSAVIRILSCVDTCPLMVVCISPATHSVAERKTGSLDTHPITHSTHRRFNAGDCVCTVHCLRHPFVRHQGVRARDSRIRCVRLHMSHTACSCTHTHSQQICTQPHADTHAHILCTSSMMKMLPSQLLMLARACSSCNLH